jgi:hypothetical protein
MGISTGGSTGAVPIVPAGVLSDYEKRLLKLAKQYYPPYFGGDDAARLRWIAEDAMQASRKLSLRRLRHEAD